MKAVGLTEAKTKFSEICARVAANGERVVITRHGKPLVTIDPIPAFGTKPASVWDSRADYEKQHGPLTEDFSLPVRKKLAWQSPLDN